MPGITRTVNVSGFEGVCGFASSIDLDSSTQMRPRSPRSSRLSESVLSPPSGAPPTTASLDFSIISQSVSALVSHSSTSATMSLRSSTGSSLVSNCLAACSSAAWPLTCCSADPSVLRDRPSRHHHFTDRADVHYGTPDFHSRKLLQDVLAGRVCSFAACCRIAVLAPLRRGFLPASLLPHGELLRRQGACATKGG